MVKVCTFDICPRRLAFGLFAGLSSGEWAWSWTTGQFPWQSDSGQMTGQWQKAIIYQYSRIGKLRASQRDNLTTNLGINRETEKGLLWEARFGSTAS